MAEELHIPSSGKTDVYEAIIPQIQALIETESNLIANLANITSILKTAFNPLWVGFYLITDNQLVLGPFQGPIACTRISKGKGVCGSVWKTGKSIIVKNVNLYPNHISCSSESVSEIVIPVYKSNGSLLGVLDLDSRNEAEFDSTDSHYLEKISYIITQSTSIK